MNTSDNSIYFMDSAFKRRWDWEFIDITSEEQKAKQTDRRLPDGTSWQEFVDNLNMFIKDNGATIRKIEDKQIGYFFIKDKDVTIDAIKNKLLFFLWDSIFNNDKKPLEKLLGGKVKLVTFGDFVRECESFIKAIKGYKQPTE
jgi:5-methylcytosine-specific restriction endonuclease McrBC GTP-binding regulatory subunit McrB